MGLEREYHLHSLASGWDEHVLGDISPKERPLVAMGAGPGFREEQISGEESWGQASACLSPSLCSFACLFRLLKAPGVHLPSKGVIGQLKHLSQEAKRC